MTTTMTMMTEPIAAASPTASAVPDAHAPALSRVGRLRRALGNTAIGRFLQSNSGVAATEFALLLPVLLTIYLGTVEAAQGITAKRKADSVARTLADLSSQSSSLDDTMVQDLFNNAAPAIMAPYPGTALRMRIYSVVFDATGKGKVSWVEERNWAGGTAIKRCDEYKGDDLVSLPNTSQVVGEVVYDYTPLFGETIVGTVSLEARKPMMPRGGQEVKRMPDKGLPACA
jgi:Flp pilus assembly protein TadG